MLSVNDDVLSTTISPALNMAPPDPTKNPCETSVRVWVEATGLRGQRCTDRQKHTVARCLSFTKEPLVGVLFFSAPTQGQVTKRVDCEHVAFRETLSDKYS